MEDKEAIYDELISPLMTQLIEVCQREGIPMFASFQYSDEWFCTSALSTGHCVFDHYRALAQCAEHAGVNVDKYMNWVAKDASKNGHGSIYLNVNDYKELIERLRSARISPFDLGPVADAIESLLAENERLKAECDEWEANSKQWEQEYYQKDTELAEYRDAPIAAYGVLEDQGNSVISWDAIAGWPEAAHEHINDAIQIWKDSGDFVPKYSVVPLIVKPGEEK